MSWGVAYLEGPVLRFEIHANAFCHQMVRSIVGTLIDVGTGKLDPDDMPAILRLEIAARPARSLRPMV